MNPLTEKQLEKMLRQTPADTDLDRAVQGLLARAERDGLIDVAYATVDSPFGELLVARTDRGVVRLALPTHRGSQRSRDEVLEELATVVSPRVLESPKRLDEERRELEDYFEGAPAGVRRPRRLEPDLARIPQPSAPRRRPDPVREDQDLRRGREVGRQPARLPRGGDACGHNPVPLIVPCHRVVQSGGGIGNYGGGPEMKRGLLDLEGAL